MTTKMKRQGTTELPRFAVGALAIAGASAASGATVQITFTGSYISTSGVNSLVTDFGGDGVANFGGILESRAVKLEDASTQWVALASGGSSSTSFKSASVWLRGSVSAYNSDEFAAVAAVRALVAVAFSDANIRSGALTNGWLDISGYANEPGEKRLTVHRLIFDDASATAPTGLTSASTGIDEWSANAVPEPSSLGLLALGAGGLLARRRRAMAA